MTKKKGRPQLSLSELMALPSSFDPSEGLSDTTIILNHWQRSVLVILYSEMLHLFGVSQSLESNIIHGFVYEELVICRTRGFVLVYN